MRNLGMPAGSASLVGMEQKYMGNYTGSWSPSAGVCMPNDIVYIDDGTLNLGTSAQSISSTWTYDPGPYTGGSVWGPHGTKEFKGAYSLMPSVRLSYQAIGWTCWFNLLIYIGGEFMPANPEFYFYRIIDPNGVEGPWTTATGPAMSILSVGCGMWYVVVRDIFNCGGSDLLAGGIHYP